MKQHAEQIIQAALQAVDPRQAVARYFAEHPERVDEVNRQTSRLLLLGVGKACVPMAQAVLEQFGTRVSAGVIITKYGHTAPLRADCPITVFEAGHPVPDEAGQQATQQLIALLSDTSPEDTVICLISGGGSALLTCPAEGLTLTDLQQVNQHLLAVGATITEINTIRKHLSAVKGGQLARLANPARLLSLVLSDVVGDPLDMIASGPTVPDTTTFTDAWQIIDRYSLADKLPGTVLAHLQVGQLGKIDETPKQDAPFFQPHLTQTAIVGSNRLAAQAAIQQAKLLGFDSQLLSTYIEGEAREVGRVVAGLAKGLARGESPLQKPACLVLGGETTVTLRGKGTGGRNQELALAVAIALEGWPNLLVACMGTDGNDGPTDAAGAFASGQTVAQASDIGISAVEHLQHNDAYNFFQPLGDLIITGPTNTNVNDLILIFAW